MEYFNIQIPVWSEEIEIFKAVVNQGIDGRLEAFTKSKFQVDGNGVTVSNRLHLDFHVDELSILLRRLLEMEDEEAERWADDIVSIQYDVEVY